MRCRDCGKFVSYAGSETPEIESEEISYHSGEDSASVMVSVRLSKCCAECGGEIASADFDFEESIEVPEEHRGEGHMLDLTVEEPEQTERAETVNRRGKLVTPKRAKTFYGVAVNYTVDCSCGDEIDTGTLDDETEAANLEAVS